MKIMDLYTPFIQAIGLASGAGKTVTAADIRRAIASTPQGEILLGRADEWGLDLNETAAWMSTPAYASRMELAREFRERAPIVVSHVEGIFGWELPGEVWLAPSLKRFDGFARYDSGSHHVIFGMDHPDADEAYLRALMAHELSHVHRDHQPEVWGFLKKPLAQVSRAEYLDNVTAKEHLVSEGLATLFSQHVYPEVPVHVHHYYEPHEMQWCLDNHQRIEESLRECLRGDEDVWSYYGKDRVSAGSPSRTQYYWAAHLLRDWLEKLAPGKYPMTLVEAHAWSAERFTCFAP